MIIKCKSESIRQSSHATRELYKHLLPQQSITI